MGKISLKKKMTYLHLTKLLLTVLLVCYCLFLLFYADLPKKLVLDARLEFSRLVTAFEDGRTEELENYKGVYLHNDGTVMKSTLEEYKEGEKVNLHRFSSVGFTGYQNKTHFFQSPVVLDGEQKGILVVEYSFGVGSILKYMGNGVFLPLLVLLLGIITVIMYERKLIIQDILNPAEELTVVMKQILKQDYQTRITYEYSGVMSELCHDLEALRDELCHTRQNEEKMKRSEKELLACISHDLKTPLASISGYVEGIKNRVVKTPEEIDSYLNIVMKKVTFISKLIDDILEHSKTELNEFSIEPAEVYSGGIFREILSDLSIDTARNGFLFTYSQIPDVIIYADKHRLSQAVNNIVGNSMKYTEKGGTIHVEFEVFDKELVVSIQDTGKGISVSDLPFIFDKFYRGEKARTLNIPGSGLGLNISRYIIEQHGGRIECDSVLDQGTTIRFSLKLI